MSNRKHFDLSLYFVADPSLCGGRDVADVVRLAASGGATMVQLRNKEGDEAEVARQACDIMAALADFDAPPAFVINDHVAVAAEVGADGVHIGQGDMTPLRAREILGDDAIIGLTAFTPAHFAALDPAVVDYAGSGPAYPTKTDKGKPVIGPQGLAELVRISPVPVVGIGGITRDNAAAVLAAGVAGIAMMRSISEAHNPRAAAQALRGVIDECRGDLAV